jgi:pimeloyl-ACP methyl ester carboxylesterase
LKTQNWLPSACPRQSCGGRQDELIPAASAEKLRGGISGAKLVVFEACGHVPQIEKPEEFSQALLEFLGK